MVRTSFQVLIGDVCQVTRTLVSSVPLLSHVSLVESNVAFTVTAVAVPAAFVTGTEIATVADLVLGTLVTTCGSPITAARTKLAIAEAEGHIGVSQSIRGRIADLGGTVDLITAPGEGTEWEMRVPISTGVSK